MIIFLKLNLYISHKIIRIRVNKLIQLKIKRNGGTFNLNAFYRSPNIFKMETYLHDLQDMLETHPKYYSYSLFLGNTYIHLLKEKEDQLNYLDMLEVYKNQILVLIMFL